MTINKEHFEIIMDSLIGLLSFVLLTSIAAERFTEILKKSVLSIFYTNPVVYQITAGLFGAGLAYLSPPDLSAIHLQLPDYIASIVIGLAVSGGSGVWNDILSTLKDYRTSIKEKS